MHLKNIESALILPLLLSCPTANVCAQVEKCDTVFLTVEQLFDRGTSQNLRLAADRLKEQMAEERRRTARTSRLPDISIGLKGGILGQPVVFQKGLSSPTYPETPDWQQNYAVDVTQPIYEGGRIRYSIKQADMEKDIAVLQTASDRADIKLALLNSYLSLFTLYSQRRVLTRNIEESERRLTDIRHMKKEGLITNNDVLRSEMQLTDNRLVLEETCNDIRIASQRLDVLLGMEENLIILPDSSLLDQTCSVSTYDEYVSMAYTSDPSMLLLQKQTELADNEIRMAKAEMLPKMSLTASNTLARPITRTMADMYNNSWNIALSITYPLSSIYKSRHRIKEARHNLNLMVNAEEQKRQNIRTDVKEAMLKHSEALKRTEALKLTVKQAEENYRIMHNRYLNQMAILTDLLDADNLRLNAQLKLTQARTDAIYTYYRLQRAVGNL